MLRFVVLLLAGIFNYSACYSASTNQQAAEQGATWLSQNQNPDGSWGTTPDVRFHSTAEAVMAFAALGNRTTAYWSGIAWLENHQAKSLDAVARKSIAISARGDPLIEERRLLVLGQRNDAGATGAWGLTSFYEGAPLDTGLVLQALSSLGQTNTSQVAINWLKALQANSPDKGWALNPNQPSDPIATAQVILALNLYKAQDAQLTSVIDQACAYLSATVSAAFPPTAKAISALALQRSGKNASGLVDSLRAAQGTEGSVNANPYVTAMAVRAWAAAAGNNPQVLAQAVAVNDSTLRAAINLALGRNSLDAINRGEMQRLVTLNVSSMGITDLTGLEAATNLAALNASNNAIASLQPISGLNIASLNVSNNPATSPPGTQLADGGDVPLPLWSLVLLGVGLMGVIRRKLKNQ